MADKDKPPADNKAAREAKLAQALRDNLRRRKASATGSGRESGKAGDKARDPS